MTLRIEGRLGVGRGARKALLAGMLAASSCQAPAGDVPASATTTSSQAALSLPEHAPESFGFGSDATEARIALWDIDVKPDGEGLPPGSGGVEQGERVYMTVCVACHGATGVEGPNDRLVGTEPWGEWPSGRAVGNYWPYATTLYDYVRKAMPQNAPGTLSSDEVYAVIAYILHLNDLVPEDAVMDAEILPEIEMPARDRFVIDDRTGGVEIR